MAGKKDRTIEEVILDNNPLEKMLRDLAEGLPRKDLDIVSVAE